MKLPWMREAPIEAPEALKQSVPTAPQRLEVNVAPEAWFRVARMHDGSVGCEISWFGKGTAWKLTPGEAQRVALVLMGTSDMKEHQNGQR